LNSGAVFLMWLIHRCACPFPHIATNSFVEPGLQISGFFDCVARDSGDYDIATSQQAKGASFRNPLLPLFRYLKSGALGETPHPIPANLNARQIPFHPPFEPATATMSFT